MQEAGYLTGGAQSEVQVRDDRVCWIGRKAAQEMMPAIASAVALLARLIHEVSPYLSPSSFRHPFRPMHDLAPARDLAPLYNLFARTLQINTRAHAVLIADAAAATRAASRAAPCGVCLLYTSPSPRDS